jgi:hypothetical protein
MANAIAGKRNGTEWKWEQATLASEICYLRRSVSNPAFATLPDSIKAAGPVVAWIIGALEGAVVVGGVSALGAGLYSIGIPKDSIVKYETALKTDQFLLIGHGTAAEVAKVKDIIESTHPLYCTLHNAEPIAA